MGTQYILNLVCLRILIKLKLFSKADVVSQTKISYSEKELLQLIADHLKAKGNCVEDHLACLLSACEILLSSPLCYWQFFTDDSSFLSFIIG